MLQNSTIKALAQEQIRRIIERQGNKIKDRLKYEQKLFQLYLKGELKFDKDIQEVIDNMGVSFEGVGVWLLLFLPIHSTSRERVE